MTPKVLVLYMLLELVALLLLPAAKLVTMRKQRFALSAIAGTVTLAKADVRPV